MNRFWIILTVIIIGLVGLFIATKPDNEAVDFTGEPATVQADDHVRGAEGDDAVTLIEYVDFQCPSCAAYFPILDELKDEYAENVRFVVRHFPLISIHPTAFAAARASEAASNQDKFWEMHDKLFETQTIWGQTAT